MWPSHKTWTMTRVLRFCPAVTCHSEVPNWFVHMEVSYRATPKIIHFLVGFSVLNHLFWGTPIYGHPHIAIRNEAASRPSSLRASTSWVPWSHCARARTAKWSVLQYFNLVIYCSIYYIEENNCILENNVIRCITCKNDEQQWMTHEII